MTSGAVMVDSTMPATLKFEVTINQRWAGEKLALGDPRFGVYNGAFLQERHTTASLAAEIAAGHSFCAVLGDCAMDHCGERFCCPERKNDPRHCDRRLGYRKNKHFGSAQFIALDFDTGDGRSSFEYLARQPLIRQHCSFLYTTLSHTTDHPKARAVLIMDSPFTDPDQYRRAKQAVMRQLPWGDASVHDPSRMFYGRNPSRGQNLLLGNIMPMTLVDALVEQHRMEMEAEQPRRSLPVIPTSRVLGATPAERYVNTAIQREAAWVANQVEGTGERHKGLLIASMKLASLRQSEWLPTEVRVGIDPVALLLPAAQANGYAAKYGEAATQQTIGDGIAYARPRPNPDSMKSSRPRIRWSGGQWVKAVRA